MPMRSLATQRPLRMTGEPNPEILPAEAWKFIRRFVLEKKTGNLTLNVRDGVVLGVRVEELVSFKH